LHPLSFQGQRPSDCPGCSVGLFIADEFANEALPRMADEQRAAEVVELPAISHERDVVLMRLAETDARIEADLLAIDARGNQRITALAQIFVNFSNHIAIGWIVLHRRWRALHVHRTTADARRFGHFDHLSVA